jgi:hypothetical protein
VKIKIKRKHKIFKHMGTEKYTIEWPKGVKQIKSMGSKQFP